jgi:hypothetical protein
MQSVDESPLIITPHQKHGVIEIDTFCTGCHYNLHGQVVSIDERLGFPVCRCPECGRFHPAGVGVTASGVWLRRWAAGLLLIWVLMVIVGTLAIAGLMAGIDGSSIGEYETWHAATREEMAQAGVIVAGAGPFSVVEIRPWTSRLNQEDIPWLPMVLMSIGSCALGLIAGTLAVTFLWHWRRRRYLALLLLPLAPAVFVDTVFRLDTAFALVRVQCMQRIGWQVSAASVGVLLGIWFGRSVSRTIIRIIIPPKPRQALAFLWQVDGKTLKP